jgi:hypothetical protein
MKLEKIIRLFLCLVLLAQPIVISAFETDQYNLPPQPLADIGDEVSDYVEENLKKAIGKINSEISARKSCLESIAAKLKREKCNSPDQERARLAYLRSPDAVAREVFKLLGDGIPPFTNSEIWMVKHQFVKQPARYKTDFEKSIFFAAPINYLTISPTVNLYGAEFGTDKIAHFFQQGYTYYKKYNRALARGLTPDKAAAKAIRWGQISERTFYGSLVSGVYSNADLYANYVGMKFYQSLTREIKIGNDVRLAVFLLKNDVWTFDENFNSRESLIKPFVSNHLNEALNPSRFIKTLRPFVRRAVRKQSCKLWLDRFPELARANYERVSRALRLWNGEDYGFTDSKNFVTIANACFENGGNKK